MGELIQFRPRVAAVKDDGSYVITAFDQLCKERRNMVFNGRRQSEVYSNRETAERDAGLIASNSRYREVRVEVYEE